MATLRLSVLTVVTLVVLAGCAGLPGADGSRPSPDEFPNASDIDQSVFDRHIAAMGNTSFTLATETMRKERDPIRSERNYTYMNETGRLRAEPGDSQYLVHINGYFSGNATIYSDGSTEYSLYPDNRTPVRKLSPGSVLNESGNRYLWRGWFANDSGSLSVLAVVSIDATYQREGIETYQGVPVMRYEATGVDALPDWAGGGNADSYFEEFSATLLLDENGVIRYYEYEFVWTDYHTRRLTETYALSDVGSTDVQKPDWVANTTPGAQLPVRYRRSTGL